MFVILAKKDGDAKKEIRGSRAGSRQGAAPDQRSGFRQQGGMGPTPWDGDALNDPFWDSEAVQPQPRARPHASAVDASAVAGAVVTPAEEITVTVGAGGSAGTDGAAGGSGYVYIEYYEEV